VPETAFGDPVTLEPVTGVDRIDKARLKLVGGARIPPIPQPHPACLSVA